MYKSINTFASWQNEAVTQSIRGVIGRLWELQKRAWELCLRTTAFKG